MALILILTAMAPAGALAAGKTINTENASEGYFTVNYASDAKMKIGVKFNNVTKYYDYMAGEEAAYAFENGSGDYTVTVYTNVSGNKYKKVADTSVHADIKNNKADLVSTYDVKFNEGDAVSAKAAEICRDKQTDSEKAVAIYNYISENLSYDNKLAQDISSAKITAYLPDAGQTLESKTGICYDMASLFAAMCRSQGIASKIVKGYYNGAYHAWNTVVIDGTGYSVDPTYGAAVKTAAKTLNECKPQSGAYTL